MVDVEWKQLVLLPLKYYNTVKISILASFCLYPEASEAGVDITSAVSSSDLLCGDAHSKRVRVDRMLEKRDAFHTPQTMEMGNNLMSAFVEFHQDLEWDSNISKFVHFTN